MMKLVVAVALAALSLPAFAADWYLGAGIADDLDGRNPRFGGDPQTDMSKTLLAGIALGGGYGIEAQWSDLGEFEVAGIADAGFRSDGDLWSIGATWAPDTGSVQPYAKLGWFWRKEDGSAQSIAGPARVDFDDNGLAAEVGARWLLSDRVALRAGYAWYDFDYDADGSVQAALELHFQ